MQYLSALKVDNTDILRTSLRQKIFSRTGDDYEKANLSLTLDE